MPIANAKDGCPINYEVEGPANAPVLMLCNSLGTNLHMWDEQAAAWSKQFRLVRYDRRGHGKSGAPKGPYTMDMLGHDALAVADAAGAKKFNWCGLSMGGMVGQWMGANARDRVEKLVLSNTHYYYADKQPWHDRIKFARDNGLEKLSGPQMERWFTKGFRDSSPGPVGKVVEMFTQTKLDGFIGCCEAVRDMDFRATTPTITAPDHGHRRHQGPGDAAGVRPRDQQDDQGLQDRLARRRASVQHRAAQGLHRRGAELPDALRERDMDDAERLKRGEAARRRVLGNEWVDRSAKNRNAFNAEWVDLITRNPWGDVWTRPHFDDRTRRVLVIGTMIALGRWEEFKLHVRAALTTGGFTADDIKEIILQQAAYCGVPAGNHAFKEAEAVLKELGKLP